MDIKGKTFLVTGGAGFIGSYLVKALLANGAKVRSFDNGWRVQHNRLSDVADNANLTQIDGDIRDRNKVFEACKGVDSVIHLAYINGTHHFYSKPFLILDVGIRGTLNVLDACQEFGIKDFVLASSSEVYQTPPQVPTDESAPLSVPDITNPRYSYGGGKIACELMVMNFAREHFNRAVIFRPHNVFGPDMGFEHVVPQFAEKLYNITKPGSDSSKFPILGDGMQKRSFIYVDDFTDALINLIQNGKHMEIYHIGTQDVVTMGDLAKKMGEAVSKKIDLVPSEGPKGETLMRCPNINKMKTLGWSPKIDLSVGLKKTIDWYFNYFKTNNK